MHAFNSLKVLIESLYKSSVIIHVTIANKITIVFNYDKLAYILVSTMSSHAVDEFMIQRFI